VSSILLTVELACKSVVISSLPLNDRENNKTSLNNNFIKSVKELKEYIFILIRDFMGRPNYVYTGENDPSNNPCNNPV
jgi:hypothetical protein